MLKVTLEVLPSDGSERRLIGYLYIENVRSSDTFLADYKVSITKLDKKSERMVEYHQDFIRKFPRSHGAWDLVRKALDVLKEKI